jgi:hypothetical protein
MATLPSYAFLPWARQGVSAKISEPDTMGSSDGTAIERASLHAELDIAFKDLDNSEQTTTIAKDIQIVGPGDVLNISAKAIVRTEPKEGISNYEDNGLPYIEFYEEDFLWRYSPAAAINQNGNQTKLRPWLALVVLKDEEFKLTRNSDGLTYITVEQSVFDNAFHHQNDTWAFSHVHMNNKLESFSGDTLKQEVNAEVTADPDVAVSRLLCPRKLAKNTGYTAFVIPAFETGRLKGLGIETNGVKAQTPSWKKGAMPASAKRPFDFPVYYQWSFRTASFGDFESLVTILKPVILDAESGKMPMDIQDPGFGLSPEGDGTKVIGMEAALRPPNFEPDPWPTNGSTNTFDQDTVDKLKAILNLSADLVDRNVVIASNNPFFNSNLGDDPLLVPPVYGVWHVLVEKLGKPGNPQWIEELNLDFRKRGAAGLGTTVVQNHQEDFVNRAWQQVNKVNEANKRIQEALLVKMVNRSAFKKHIINAGNDKAVMLTDSIQHLIKNTSNTKTVQQDFIESRIPNASKSAAFRRIARPNSKITQVSVKAALAVDINTSLVKANTIIQNFNRNESEPNVITAAKVKVAPDMTLATADIGQTINLAIQNYNNDPVNLAKDALVELVDVKVVQGSASWDKIQLQTEVNNANITPANVKTEVDNLVNSMVSTSFPIQKNADGQVIIQINNDTFKKFFGEGIHVKNFNQVILKDDSNLTDVSVKSMTTKADVVEFQNSFTQFQTIVDALPHASLAQAFSNVASVSSHIFSAIDPAVTLAKKLTANIRIFRDGAYVPLPELKPVMAYPEFTEAVYEYLLALSKNYILPNIDKLPNNSITLMENNQSFIEAFMAGLNHEMARELLWREYPTDQRGSYFRQFWSIKDNLFPDDENDPENDKELKLDIRKIHEWSGKLGDHNPRARSANLVLVIRGDLFKKYPNTMVYAQQAEYNTPATAPRKLKGGIDSANTKFPLFKADIEPDITLFGFDLDEDEARGDRIEDPNESTTGKNPGWFFVLKERPGQIRFGLDDFTDELGNTDAMPTGMPADWNGLSWEHLVNSNADLDTYHITFSKAITIQNPANQPLWGINSADMAAILYQNPVLFARHAGEMLPED